MSFKKYMHVEKVTNVLKRDDSTKIRKLVKEAGKTSAADLTDEQRRSLPR